MNLWWLALPVLLLPVLWHRRKRESLKAVPLATARFMPPADPRQVRTWTWQDRVLLLLRLLLLLALIARLAGLVVPWRSDTVLVVPGTDPAWAERQARQAGFAGARQVALPHRDAFGWLAAHEDEFRAQARIMVAGDVAMPALAPQFRHTLVVRTAPQPVRWEPRHVAVTGDRAAAWRGFFEASSASGQRYEVSAAPGPQTDLVVWDEAGAPPAAMTAPLWWAPDAGAIGALSAAREVDGLRYVDTPHGRVWHAAAMPPETAAQARWLLGMWQRLHYPAVPYTVPSQTIAAAADAPSRASGTALRHLLDMLLVILLAAERILAHARRA